MRSVLALLALAALLLMLGSAEGWSLLHSLGYSLLLAIGLCYLWSWCSVRGIYVRQRARVLRSQVGSHFEERAEIENLNWLPRPWLEVLDGSNHPEHNLSQVLSLGPQERRARVLRTLCRQRGEFRLGPVRLAGGDPFGLFREERQVSGPTTLVVLPSTVDLPAFGRLPGELPGGSLQGERVHFTTPNAASIRDYQPGDSYSRLHWPSTARLGRLTVKEYERDPFSDLWLVLDLDPQVHFGTAPESTEEYAVTVTASLSRHFLESDRAVGVLSQDRVLPVDRGPWQLIRTLEYLATARPGDQQPLAELLLQEIQRLGRRDNLVIVTASYRIDWVSICRDIAARGVQSSVVQIQAATFGFAPSNARLLGALGAANIPTYVVSKGAGLPDCLAQPALVRA